MIEAMVDNETWGIRTTSVVRSTGIVVFDGRRVIEKLYFRIDEDEQEIIRDVELFPDERTVFPPRTRDDSTVTWWAKPENAAAQDTILQAPLLTWRHARSICGQVGEIAQNVWAKPGMFDLPMLRDLFGQDIWPYWKERDLSTLLGEFDPNRETRPSFVGVPHNALDDAIHAHEWLMRVRDMMPELLAKSQGTKGGKIWTCKIGECSDEELNRYFAAADEPMRNSISAVYRTVTGREPDFIFSGWGGVLDRVEREVVEEAKKRG